MIGSNQRFMVPLSLYVYISLSLYIYIYSLQFQLVTNELYQDIFLCGTINNVMCHHCGTAKTSQQDPHKAWWNIAVLLDRLLWRMVQIKRLNAENTHTIHGTEGIFTYIYYLISNGKLVGTYTIFHIQIWVVVSNIFNFHPDPWGFMIQFDLRIFYKWVGENTTN